MTESSRAFDLLVAVSRDRLGTLGAQVERQLHSAIRGGSLRARTL